MKTIRYFLLTLFVLAPGFASAQVSADSLLLVIDGTEYPAIAPNWVRQLEEGEVFGPEPLAVVEPAIACEPIPGTDPVEYQALVENPEEIEGNIAIVSRGSCTFVLKVEAVAAAGAVGIVLWNGIPAGEADPDAFPAIGGAPTELTNIPAAFVSWNTGQVALEAAKFGLEATFVQTFTGPEFPPDPPNTTVGVHDTGIVELEVFDYGFIGDDAFLVDPGFSFNGEPGLYASTVLVGQVVGQDTVVNSNPYAGGNLEWTSVAPVTSITPAPPYEAFDTGYTTIFDADDLDIQVTEDSYSKADDPYVIFELAFTNTSDSDMEDVYVGIFADFDVGAFASNLGGYDEAQSLLYAYDESGTSTNYFGVAALGDVPVSGYALSVPDPGVDADLFDALTNDGDATVPGDTAQDLRTALGVGPFSIAAGTSVTAYFAFVAGASEAEIIANAQAAQGEIIVAVEETTPEGTFVLESAYPNPFSARTTIGFTLPTAQDVRVTVYDVLGREVATLVDGVRQAGPQTVEFDASSLPSGMYIYRLEAGSTQLTQQVTLVR